LTLFAWLISHQPAVLFSQNKSATSNQPAVLFSQNKSAPAISHQPTEQAAYRWMATIVKGTTARREMCVSGVDPKYKFVTMYSLNSKLLIVLVILNTFLLLHIDMNIYRCITK
jgi:hypothetical protein